MEFNGCLRCGKNDLGVLLDIIVEIKRECALKYQDERS
jgi:hypothetical protein